MRQGSPFQMTSMKLNCRCVTAALLVWILGSLLAGCNYTSGAKEPGVQTAPVLLPSPSSTALPAEPTSPPTTTATISPTEIPFKALSYQARNCDYGGEFKQIEALDRYSVRFSLCKADVAFLEKLAFPTFGIQPRGWLEETGGGGSLLLEQPVGTGPYRLLEWKHGESLTFQAFDDYWGQTKELTPQLVFRWSPDAAQRLVELQAGTADGANNVDPLDWTTVQAETNLSLLLRPPLSVAMVGIDNTTPPLDNEKVRLALALGIDRQKLVNEAFPAGYERADYFTPCIIPNGCLGTPWYAYDPEQARQLLSEAGYPDGFTVELFYRDVVRGYLPRPSTVAAELRTQLRTNLNIRATLHVMESNAFLEALEGGQLKGLFLLGWGADYPDVTNFLDTHFGVGAPLAFGNPFDDVRTALKEGASSADERVRGPYYQAANEAIRQHVPAIPLAYGSWITPSSMAVAYRKDMRGAQASPFGFEDFSRMFRQGAEKLVWMQEAEPRSLYCADEAEIDTLRACMQVTEGLYRYQAGEVKVEPALAEICRPDASLMVWTCNLRQGVRFHNGAKLDANDVVVSFVAQWDAAQPLHVGRTGEFAYFRQFWGNFLNAH